MDVTNYSVRGLHCWSPLFYCEVKFLATIYDKLSFVYDGISSDSMGITHCTVGKSGLLEETFMPSVEIKEVKIRGNDTPYFMEKVRSPLTLPLQLAFQDGFTDDQLNSVAQWLGNQPYYKELYFVDEDGNDTGVRYYGLFQGDAKIIHNGASQGYIEINFRNVDCYKYSPVYESTVLDCSTNTSSGINTSFENKGDVTIKPVFILQKVGAGDISIVNTSNGGQTMTITGLADNETVTIDGDYQDIQSDIPNTYRFTNHNGVFIEMVNGFNYIQIYGNCLYKVQYQYRYLT